MQKERITVTLDPELVARIDRAAELRGHSRSKMMEKLLDIAVEEEEKAMRDLASPILGPIVQSILDHPKLVAMIAKTIGEKIDPEDLNKWEEAGERIRRTRDRLKDERGHRHDLRKEA